MLTPPTRPWRPITPLLSVTLLATALAACGGSTDDDPYPAAPYVASEDDASAPGYQAADPAVYTRGARTLVCDDKTGDVKTSGKAKAPGWADLRSVGFERTPGGATVSYLLRDAPPTQGTAEFTARFAAGGRSILLRTALAKGTWQVTAEGDKIGAVAKPQDDLLVVVLPLRIEWLDLASRSQVSAAASGGTAKASFSDQACGRGTVWKPDPQTTASPRPTPSPTRARPGSTSSPKGGSTSRPRKPSGSSGTGGKSRPGKGRH